MSWKTFFRTTQLSRFRGLIFIFFVLTDVFIEIETNRVDFQNTIVLLIKFGLQGRFIECSERSRQASMSEFTSLN